jgi:hypothetical protein
MSAHRRIPPFALLVLTSFLLHAQTPAGVSGHWEGVIHAPGMDIVIEVDLAPDAAGKLAGTFSNPARNVRAFPLANVEADGTSVTFAIPAATGGGTFSGTLAPDGKSMKGTFATKGPDAQPLDLPFELTHAGPAKIDAPAKSSAIGKDLEGRWSGALEVEGTTRQIGLSLVNHADGTATGVVISGEGIEVPITVIAQKGSSVTLDVKNIGGSYAGTLGNGGAELVGTWTQGPFSAPLTFRRVKGK